MKQAPRTDPRGRHALGASLVALGLAAAITPAACRQGTPDERIDVAPAPGGPSTGPSGPSGGPSSVAGSASASGSSSSGAGGGPPAFTKRGLLESAADCAIARYEEFAELAATLRDTTAALAGDPTSEAKLADARIAWLAAESSWQVAEPFSFGPAARSSEPGGQDLRDQIYAWPLGSRCKTEQQIVDKAYESPAFPQTLISGRGLGAIEYLLFYYDGTDNACSSVAAINSQGTWAALSAAELVTRKAAYAAAAAKDVAARAEALRAAWAPSGGDFRKELVEAGGASAVFASEQAALNAVSNALFYVEKEVKDLKVAKPLGLLDCTKATCPEAIESQFAHVASANVINNLVGFRLGFEGCGGGALAIGFDDWLEDAGAASLAADMRTAIDAAHATAQAMDPPLDVAIYDDLAEVEALHASIKGVTDLLKTELVTVLDLELPKTSEGDND
jgi:predicted lipoprotein